MKIRSTCFRKFLVALAFGMVFAGVYRSFSARKQSASRLSAGWVEAVDLMKEKRCDKLRGLLDKQPELVRMRSSLGNTLLHEAVATRAPKCLEVLLEMGSDINSRAPSGATALWLAAMSENANAAEILVRQGADVTIRSQWVSEDGSSVVYLLPVEIAERLHNEEVLAVLRGTAVSGPAPPSNLDRTSKQQ